MHYTLYAKGVNANAVMFVPAFLSPPKLQSVFSSSESSPQPEKINLEDLTGIVPGTLNQFQIIMRLQNHVFILINGCNRHLYPLWSPGFLIASNVEQLWVRFFVKVYFIFINCVFVHKVPLLFSYKLCDSKMGQR